MVEQIILQQYAPNASTQIDPECLEIRKRNFPNQITFHAPGLRRYKTSEYEAHTVTEFVSISLTGTNCALSCDHCNMQVLKGMSDFTEFDGSLFDFCVQLSDKGARGVLISGGSDKQGRVPLLKHIPDLIKVRKELGLAIPHPGQAALKLLRGRLTSAHITRSSNAACGCDGIYIGKKAGWHPNRRHLHLHGADRSVCPIVRTPRCQI